MSLSRRRMMQASGLLAASFFAGTGRAAAAPRAVIDALTVISKQADLYHGWPTLARRRDGQLILAWSGGREGHICPFGRVDFMTSPDGGATWTWPRTLLDGPIDDRDAGIVETAKGSILVTTFTSLAYEPTLQKAQAIPAGAKGAWAGDRLARWQAAHARIGKEERQKELGTWMMRSTDGGVSWSSRYEVPVNSPHGPVQLSDGRLLYAGVELWKTPRHVGICSSEDDGQSWTGLTELPARKDDDPANYHELHAVEAADGQLIVHIRNHNKANPNETLQTESADGGRTWSEPHAIGVWGLPSHLLRLKDCRLLMTYGHRRAPLGNQARVSDDGGRSWSEPMILSDDGSSGDLGYPSTVQLDDGSLVTVWYEVIQGNPNAVLRQAKWRVDR